MKKLTGILPSIIAVYFVIFLYSHNCQELILRKACYPLMWAVLFSILVTGVTLFFSKNLLKSEIISAIFVIMFFAYGYLFDILYWDGFTGSKHRIFLPMFVMLMYFVADFIAGLKNDGGLNSIRSTLIIMFCVLIVFNVIRIVPQEMNKIQTAGAVNAPASKVNTIIAPEKSPDVYYFILDEYASSKTIKNVWGYDNSYIENFLINKGFVVAQDAVGKYNTTTKALPSYLNMEYVDKKTDTTTSYKMINQSKVMARFKELGYTNIALDNWYSANPAKGPVIADYNFNYSIDAKVSVVDGLTNLIVNQSMLRPFSYMIYQQYGDIDDNNRNATLYAFSKIPEVININGPKFVYAHILCPHTPFTFDQNGGHVNVIHKYNWKEKKYYLDQYIYINKNIVATVNHILNNSTNPPIIIIQSDHGPRPQYGQVPATRFTIPEEEMYRTFYSYYLPNQRGGYLAGRVDPVDTFKMVFQKYFGDPQ